MPYLNPPARSILQNLPPELLHNIFECLHEEDVPVARATYTIMASVGLDHFGTEIPLVFHRQKFRTLTEIAKHPVFSSRMTSLFYMCDYLGINNYRSWDNDREWRSFQRAVVAEVGSAPSTASASAREAFEQYLALSTDRIILEHGLVDFDCISELFEGCRNLREITVACQDYCDRRLNASCMAFEHTMAEPSERFDWRDAGLDKCLAW